MSFLESLSGDKPVIVLDIGHAYTKCGYSGETGPHSIIPSKLTMDAATSSSFRSSNSTAQSSLYDYRTLVKTDNDSILVNRDDEKKLKELLVEFIYRIYFKILNVNSRERKVVIVESVLTPTVFRQALAEVLFKNFQAVSVCFLSSHLASLYTLGITTALVLDCGYMDSQIMPIAEGVPMLGLCDSLNLGGKRLHDEIESLIREHALIRINDKKVPFKEVNPQPELTEELIEDIKVRCCFVTKLERSRLYQQDKANFKFVTECEYSLPNNMVMHVPGFVREMACECLFVDALDEKHTIPHLILNTLLKSPIDLRIPFSKSVVLMGGTCMLVGFKSRLVSEINDHLSDPKQEYNGKLMFDKLSYHVPPSFDNYTAWLGGAIFGSLDTLDSQSIPNLKFKDMEKLPDWFAISLKETSRSP